MPVEYRIISIGTLASNPLWDESSPVRTGHATTTLVSATGSDASAAGTRHIIVNPSLPAQALAARMSERGPTKPGDITDVFLTNLDRDHWRGIEMFPNARWLAFASEIEAAQAGLDRLIKEARNRGDQELLTVYRYDETIMRRIKPAPDRLAPGVDLFPLPGVSAGTCGLLLSLPRRTVLICGDAIATSEHLAQGKVLPECESVDTAWNSFREAIEIADVFIPGRDNICGHPFGQGMSGRFTAERAEEG